MKLRRFRFEIKSFLFSVRNGSNISNALLWRRSSTESTYRSPKSFVILNFFFQKVSFFKGTSPADECQAKRQRQGEVHVALAVLAIQ